MANNVPALISYVDREQRYRFSNRTYDDWFGIAHEQMLGRTLARSVRRGGLRAHAQGHRALPRRRSGGVRVHHRRGRPAPHAAGRVRAAPRPPDGRRCSASTCSANDVTALKRAQEDLRFAAVQLQHDARRLEFLAHHDTLTGLPNRAMFADRAREAVAHARRHDKTAAFLFLDMDNFKQVNDSLGHEVGDGLLKLIASRLRASVRGDDFVARIGGDEFCVLLQDIAEPREAAAVAQKLLHELGKPYRVGEHDVRSGASIGIACVPQDGDDVGTLLRLADHAMYRAKELGRNGYQFFSGVLNDDAAAAAELADELRTGFERGELFLVYQPRIDIGTRQVVGAEALLRWRHPRHGVLAPEAFLPLADDTGLLGADGRLGAARSLPAGPALARRRHPAVLGGGQHERAPAAQRQPRRAGARGARGERPAARIAADRAARDRAAPDPEPLEDTLRRVTAMRRAPRRRRFRHRLRLAAACCSACAPARCASTAAWSSACRTTPSAPASRGR